MSATISQDDVTYVAALAKIAITNEEAARFTKELDAILGYVKQLETVDTTGLEPTYQVTGLKNVTRKDEVIDYGTSRDDLLKNTPRSQDGYIKVPKVL
ncbi:MAG TPA: Asp-tRNA(Asn)/Glu-tRNA(Gln) amidotransferase subunit GatC [Candidatus Saccharimonadales bacterium]|nr:Asp-tRNA(Asn)/Glu-tRNA(Gln) amidotransferase subunit GatC [Candidatus Saccharimonadales bacterium]